mgnify:FL=1
MRLIISFIVAAIGSTFIQAQTVPPTRAERLKKDISYLASDELQGRQTGSPGELMSAEYIKKQFIAAKLQPQTQEFDIVKLRLASNKCLFGVRAPGIDTIIRKLTLFSEYFPLSQSANFDSVTAPWVDCGYGLVHEKSKRDDYIFDIKGKIALIRLGFPGMQENPHGELAEVAEIPNKIAEATKRGAVGIIFIKPFTSFTAPSGNLKRDEKTLDIPVFYCNQTSVFPAAPITLVSNIYVLKAQGHNVYAFRNNHKKNTIVICAHHDHIGINEYENSRYTGKPEIHNGADDNASGVAAMLEMSRTLKGRKYKKNNYLFIAFSGEELGLLGSKFFTQNPPLSLTGNTLSKLGKINYVINIDMLGRIDTSKKILTLNGVGTSPQFEKTISLIKTDTNQIKIVTTKSGLGPSDHASFYIENIPVVHFFSGQHEDYHKPSDDENLINYMGMVNSLDVMEQLISLNNKKGKLPFTKTQDATAGRTKFKVTLGVMPDYSYTGNGMRIDGVTDGKPAQKAGLKKGDIITKLGDMPVNGIEDYMVGLGKINPENPSTVVVLRGDEVLTLPINFQ